MVGKPKIEGKPRSTNVLVRVLPEERERWHNAARRAGQTLSDWLRAMANRAAKRTKR